MRRPLLALLPFVAACYNYAPIDPSDITSGTDVRVRVSAAAGEQIAPLLGSTSARLLSGTVIQPGRDTMVVEVPTTVRAEVGASMQTLNQRVSIARRDILEMERRTLDRRRTNVLAGAVAAVVIATAFQRLRGEPGKDKLPGDGSTELIIPLFRR